MFLAVFFSVGATGGIGYLVYQWRLKQYMNTEIRSIMSQARPIPAAPPIAAMKLLLPLVLSADTAQDSSLTLGDYPYSFRYIFARSTCHLSAREDRCRTRAATSRRRRRKEGPEAPIVSDRRGQALGRRGVRISRWCDGGGLGVVCSTSWE